MSRLYDRIIALGGTRQATLHEYERYVLRNDEVWRASWEEAEENWAREFMQASAERDPRSRLAHDRELAGRHFRKAHAMEQWTPTLDPIGAENLIQAPMFVADQIADYLNRFPASDISDVVGPLAPPYDQFFIEVQGLPADPRRGDNPHAWGILFQARDIEDATSEVPERYRDEAKWVLNLLTVVEWNKGDPVGPLAIHSIPVGSDGAWLGLGTGEPWQIVVNRFVGQESGDMSPMPDLAHRAAYNVYTLAPLQALSMLHCRNVEARLVEPSAKQSKAHMKRKGGPLHRHRVLEVAHFTRALDEEGRAQQQGIKHALHACRGHFKTYTEDAPLMGRHVGTFWWAPSIRGSASAGVVTKDYNVQAPEPADLGIPYKSVDDDAQPRQPAAPDDPDGSGPGLRAHNRTQNALASHLRTHGRMPRTPAKDEPLYDLAWGDAREQWVVEVKSITDASVERQLRMATGQVLRYQDLLAKDGLTVHAVVCTSTRPSDSSWMQLLERHGVMLTWAPDFPGIPGGHDPEAN